MILIYLIYWCNIFNICIQLYIYIYIYIYIYNIYIYIYIYINGSIYNGISLYI